MIVHVAAIDASKISGPGASVPPLVQAQNSLDRVEAALLVSVGAGPGDAGLGLEVMHYSQLHSGGGLVAAPPPFNRPDVVVFHSTYIPAHAKLAHQLHGQGVPYIITPRGGMTRQAQDSKWLKKRIGNLLFFNTVVQHAVALHCLTENEAKETAGWNRPIFVVGNGTKLPPQRYLAQPGKRRGIGLVFIGRLDPKHKGLDKLLEACASIRSTLLQQQVHVDLYGPDHEGGERLVRKQIRRLRLNDLVKLHGPVRGQEKQGVLAESDVFVHTSRWEGQPNAVLEALAHGLPCLLTPGTNMSREVALAGAGWDVELSAAGIADGIKRVLEERKGLGEFGKRARLLVAEKYDWQVIAERTVEAYEACLKAYPQQTPIANDYCM